MRHTYFASDNSATVHPDILAALQEANSGHARAYGDDPWTQRATEALKQIFGDHVRAYFVYSGTGANVIGLSSALRGFEGVICGDMSHINYDECGAVERFSGSKLLPLPTSNGRLKPDQVREALDVAGVVHHTQPRIVSLTQATEVGTVYTPAMVREIADACHDTGLLLHMDGARIANAAVSLDATLAEVSIGAGVDILSLGGTKNGLMFGEAIVVAGESIADSLHYAQKQGMQLASKMRYIAAQFHRLFGTELWRENAAKANTIARALAERLSSVDGVDIVYPVEANGVFVRLPSHVIDAVRQEIFFYDWEPRSHVVRLMCSFDNSMEDVDALEKSILRHLGQR